MNRDAVVHDFIERLEWSADLSDEPAWADFYKRVWPDLITSVRIDKDGPMQRAGIDRLLILPQRQITVDEKKRGAAYNDILLEEWSVCGGFDRSTRSIIRPQKVGWALDDSKRCDFMAYAVPKLQVCYLLPYDLLRLASKRNMETWKASRTCSYPIVANNKGYSTVSVGVPWGDLRVALNNEMQRNFSGDLVLPVRAFNESGQIALFEF